MQLAENINKMVEEPYKKERIISLFSLVDIFLFSFLAIL